MRKHPIVAQEAEGEEFVADITGCARCHGDGHDGLQFKPFNHPFAGYTGDFLAIRVTHYAMCPEVEQPIWYAFAGKEPIGTVAIDDDRLRTEWRICGESTQRGIWRGSWRDRDPMESANTRYEVNGYIGDGSIVWIERRQVWEGEIVKIDAGEALKNKSAS